jgi:shikimate dehydrogenase
MKTLGLIGHPVSHSKSPQIFAEKFKLANRSDLAYKLFDLDEMSDFMTITENDPSIVALNVTVPYKKTIIPLLDEISEEAHEIGAVNTIVKVDGRWMGHNTDAWGFRRSLQPFLKGKHERALIFGSGGASKAVAYSLRKLGINYHIIRRKKSKISDVTYQDLTSEAIKHHLLLVNCTPVGMKSNNQSFLEIPYDGISKNHLVVDLVYNPETTKLMSLAHKRGAVVLNGMEMLRMQAEKTWDIWLKNGI